MNAKRITYPALYAVAAIALGLIENALPPIVPVAGVKIGLGNAVVLFALVTLSVGEAALILAAKCLVVALASGNVFALAYSLPAGFAALAVEALLIRFFVGKLSLAAVSYAGAIVHTAAQIAVASAIVGVSLLAYFPIAGAVSGVCGAAVGVAAAFAVKALPEKFTREDDRV